MGREPAGTFNGLEVIFIGVHCPLEELERREKERDDRKAGLARLQFAQVHVQAIYDIKVDTSAFSPEECATIIVDYMNSGNRPTAFDQLRENKGGLK